MRLMSTLIAVGALGLMAASAHAAVMATRDFNSFTPPSISGGYAYNYHAFTDFTYSITTTTVSAGDNALLIQASVVKQPWWGVVWGSASLPNQSPLPAPRSTLTLSFDAMAVGGTSFDFSVGTHGDDPGMTNTVSRSFAVSNTWQNYTVTLDTFTPDTANLGTFDSTAAYIIFGATMSNTGFGNLPANVSLSIDNIVLTGPATAVVPEPASLGLLGLGALALLRRRR